MVCSGRFIDLRGYIRRSHNDLELFKILSVIVIVNLQEMASPYFRIILEYEPLADFFKLELGGRYFFEVNCYFYGQLPG